MTDRRSRSTLRSSTEYRKNAGLVFANFKPSPPSRYPYLNVSRGDLFLRKGDPCAEDCGDRWVITAEFGRVAPKGKFFAKKMFVGGQRSGRFTLDARIFTDNLTDPTVVTLTIDVRASETPELSVANFVGLVDTELRKR